jgi:hypothetical protein
MCDYSLLGVPNRLAVEGEELVVHRFNTGSIGLTETQGRRSRKQNPNQTLWSTVKAWFTPEEPRRAVAVCVPPGASLMVHNMPEDIQRSFASQATELVTFTQLSVENAHRDAIRLGNGAEILLQRLREGQKVSVVKLGISEEENAPATNRVMTESPCRR